MDMKIVPKGLNLEYLVKSKHLFEGNKEHIANILRVGSKPLIEEKILAWEQYHQQKEEKLENLKLDLEQNFSNEKVLEEIRRVHIYGENAHWNHRGG